MSRARTRPRPGEVFRFPTREVPWAEWLAKGDTVVTRSDLAQIIAEWDRHLFDRLDAYQRRRRWYRRWPAELRLQWRMALHVLRRWFGRRPHPDPLTGDLHEPVQQPTPE